MIDKHLAELRVQVKTLKDDLCTPTISMRDQMNKIRFEMLELQIELVDKAIKRMNVEPPKTEGNWGAKPQPNGWSTRNSSPLVNFTLKLKHPQNENNKNPPPKAKDEPKKAKDPAPKTKEEPKKS